MERSRLHCNVDPSVLLGVALHSLPNSVSIHLVKSLFAIIFLGLLYLSTICAYSDLLFT